LEFALFRPHFITFRYNFGTEFKPSNQLPLLEYGSPFHEVPGSPGLWIDLVGRDSLWPIGYRPLTPTLDNCSYIDQLEPAPRLVSNSNEPSGTQFGSADEPPTNYHLMLERTRGLFNGAFLILLVVLGAACILFSIVISDDSPVHSPDPKKLSESPPYKTPANDSVSNLVPTNNATELPATAPEENSRVNAKSGSTEKGATDATAKPVTQERPEIALIGTSLTPNPTQGNDQFPRTGESADTGPRSFAALVRNMPGAAMFHFSRRAPESLSRRIDGTNKGVLRARNL
jgi:hypothetical protein